MLSERSQTQKPHTLQLHLYEILKNLISFLTYKANVYLTMYVSVCDLYLMQVQETLLANLLLRPLQKLLNGLPA